jgi:hypothetical protein
LHTVQQQNAPTDLEGGFLDLLRDHSRDLENRSVGPARSSSPPSLNQMTVFGPARA